MKRIPVSLAALFLVLLFGFAPAGQACAEGSAPITDNLELTTRRGVPIEGLLSAKDAEGDLKSFAITTKPVKGEIRLEDGGRFVYTPRLNKKGRDYFGYRAIDKAGNVSQEATAIIRIEK